MSLIRCPECKQPMSDTLSVRLHCGYNLSDEGKVKAYGESIVNPIDMNEAETKVGLITLLVVFDIIITLGVVFSVMMSTI